MCVKDGWNLLLFTLLYWWRIFCYLLERPFFLGLSPFDWIQ